MKVEEEYPGLCKEFTKAGKVRWRVRVAGQKRKKLTIPVGPGHAQFRDHYDAARVGRKLEVTAQEKPLRGTLDELRERYCAAMAAMVAAGSLDKKTLLGRTRGLIQACDTKSKRVSGWGQFRRQCRRKPLSISSTSSARELVLPKHV